MNNNELARTLVTNTLIVTIFGGVLWVLFWLAHILFIWIGPFSLLSWWALIPIGVGFIYGLFVSVLNYFVI